MDSLGHDLLSLIFEKLQVKELLNLRLLCTRFVYVIDRRESIWKLGKQIFILSQFKEFTKKILYEEIRNRLQEITESKVEIIRGFPYTLPKTPQEKDKTDGATHGIIGRNFLRGYVIEMISYPNSVGFIEGASLDKNGYVVIGSIWSLQRKIYATSVTPFEGANCEKICYQVKNAKEVEKRIYCFEGEPIERWDWYSGESEFATKLMYADRGPSIPLGRGWTNEHFIVFCLTGNYYTLE